VTFPTTLDAISPAFLSEVLQKPVTAVTRVALAEPWTNTVAVLTVTLADGATQRLVAKVRRADRGHTLQFEQELHFYERGAARLSCVPRMRFGAMEGEEAFLLLLDHDDGAHLRQGFDLETSRRALQALAQVHGTVWGDALLRSGLRDKRVLPKQAAELVHGVRANWDMVAARFPRHLEAPDLSTLHEEVSKLVPVTLTHNDLHAENILVSPHRIVFVDWQNATWSTPAYDVANILAGCAHPAVQQGHWQELLAYYGTALREAGGPPLPGLEADVSTSTALLFAWMMRYLASASDREIADRAMVLEHWERVCSGVSVTRAG